MQLLRWARERFWVLPLLCALGAGLLGYALTNLDEALARSLALPFIFHGGPEGARALLSAIITSMISFTGLVFSITIVVLQLTSSQFSPRILRTFLRDRQNQLTLGVFVATFVYAMLVLRAVRGTAQVDPFVPQIATTVAFGFVLASIVVFLAYIHHIAQSIRAATIIATIGDEARERLEQREPGGGEGDPRAELPRGAVCMVAAEQPGIVQLIDEAALVDLAHRTGATLELLRAVGEFVPAGAPLAAVHGLADPDDRRDGQLRDGLRAAVTSGTERLSEQDIGFGLRQLVDIAERALSPGVNDPTTALQAVDQVHDLLRRLATRTLGPRVLCTQDGRLAVVLPEPTFAEHLTVAIDEVARWGADSPRIEHRLRGLLRDLATVALPQHRPAIAQQLARWDEVPPGKGVLDLTPSDAGLRPDPGQR